MPANPKQGPTTGLAPHLAIPDKRAAEAIDFYVRAFGATERIRIPAEDGERLMHAHVLINGASVLLHDDFPEHAGGPMTTPSGVTLHLQVTDTDKWYKRAVAAGATVIMPPENMFWGDRYGQVQDPFGHRWSIGSHIEIGD